MSILLLADAKAQVRITSSVEDTLLQKHLDAAEKHVARYLNRNVYADQSGLDTAVAAVPAALAAAQAAYDAASDAWAVLPDDTQAPAALAWEKAMRDYREAKAAARRTYGGIVINDEITLGVLLLFGSFANNREQEMTDNTAKSTMLQIGVYDVVGPYRIDEGV